MTINKYQGKTKEEAIEKAKQELGDGVVVLNVKEIKPKGMLKAFKTSMYEVTAAIEEREQFAKQIPKEPVNLAADEKISIAPIQRETVPVAQQAPAPQQMITEIGRASCRERV